MEHCRQTPVTGIRPDPDDAGWQRELAETGALALPGERLPFRAEYPAELNSGRNRVFASFQYEEKVITNSRDFTVR